MNVLKEYKDTPEKYNYTQIFVRNRTRGMTCMSGSFGLPGVCKQIATGVASPKRCEFMFYFVSFIPGYI